jgi:hypothetical protein
MAKNDFMNPSEVQALVSTLAKTGSWDEAKAACPKVSDATLEKGFKKYAFENAGLDLAKYEAAEKAAKLEAEKAAKAVKAGGKPLDPDPL